MVWLRKVCYRVPIMAQSSSPTKDLDESAIAEALSRIGILSPGERPRCQPLEGGVSSDIWLIDLPGRRLCLKRALPQLKTEQLWEHRSNATATSGTGCGSLAGSVPTPVRS